MILLKFGLMCGIKWILLFGAVILFIIPTNSFDLGSLFGRRPSSSSSSSSSSSKKKSGDDELQPVDDNKAKSYLQQFGYVAPSQILSAGPGLSADLSDVKAVFKSAIRKFQEFAGLNPTGELDIRTKKKMAEPRCGLMDVSAISTSGSEPLYKWPKQQITYTILSYSPDLPHTETSEAIRKAFQLWSEKSPVDFTEISSGNADIKIKFSSRDHGDPWPFDGRGGVLAHATMPTSGMLHFDEDENWVYMDAEKIASSRYTDIYPVAIHEIGHTLGLSHSRTEDSIMAPFYQETVDENGKYVMPKLKPADIKAIQDIYGLRRGGASSSGSSSRGRGGFSSFFGNNNDGDDFDGRMGGGSGRNNNNDDNEDKEFSHGRHVTTTERSHTTKKSFFGSFWGSWLGDRSSSRSRSQSEDNGDSDRDDSPTSNGRSSTNSDSNRGSSNSDSDRGFDSANCPSTIDAFTPGIGGVSYMFQGSKVFELRGRSIQRSHSLRILFPNGPIYVEAAFVNSRLGTIALFQSYNIYVFEFNSSTQKFRLVRDYPKRVNGFNPVGAMLWNDGHEFLFSRNGEFAVYDDYWNEVQSVNQINNYFPGFPVAAKGGLSDGGSEVTVFTTTRVYRYDTKRRSTVGNSQSISDYLGCN